MKRFFILFIMLLFPSTNLIFAQQDTTKKSGWFPSGVAGINLSQIALNNWTQGGDNSLSWTLTGNFSAKYISDSLSGFTLENSLKFAYGRTKLGGQDYRTNDNEFYLVNLISKKIDNWEIEPFFSNSVRSTITKGYDYKTAAPTEIADFFDPGYVTQSIGFNYERLEHFKTRLGVAAQEVFTKYNTKYTDDPATPEIETYRFDLGIESVTSSEFTVAQNLLAKTNLRLFSRYKKLSVWDVRWDNALIAKVNDFINVSLTFLFVYQEDQSKQAQMKQTLLLGIVYTVF